MCGGDDGLASAIEATVPGRKTLTSLVGRAVSGAVLSECRRGKNTRHLLTGLLRRSVFGRLACYEDVNDADRLPHDPAMRAVVDRQGLDRAAASTSQMGRFETGRLTSKANLAALLSGAWIDRVHARRPQTTIVLDLDSSASETHGVQEGSATTGTLPAPATTRCSCSTSSAIWNAARCGPAMSAAPMADAMCWSRWWHATGPN
jgi:Transposase DDE domain group 1